MYPYIKYLNLLAVAFAGCLLFACSSDMPDKTPNGEGAQVTFAVTDRSRASMTTAIDRFAVYGDMKFMGESSPSPINIFDKTEVVKTNNVWQYQGTRYWFHNHEHSFVAIHPLSVLDAAQYADSKLSFNYTLPASNDDAADIITATHRRLFSEGDAVSPITLSFGHLLSLINFSLELTEPSARSEECFKIHKLEMSGFGTEASINITPAQRLDNSLTNDSEINIVTAQGTGSLQISFEEPIVVINGADAVKMFEGTNAIIMLPQTLAGENKVDVSLTYSVNDEEETTKVSAPLSSFTWESGKSYNYRIKLELEPKEVNMSISNATIEPWSLIDDPNYIDAI